MFVMNCKYIQGSQLAPVYLCELYVFYMISLVPRLSPRSNKASDGKLGGAWDWG